MGTSTSTVRCNKCCVIFQVDSRCENSVQSDSTAAMTRADDREQQVTDSMGDSEEVTSSPGTPQQAPASPRHATEILTTSIDIEQPPAGDDYTPTENCQRTNQAPAEICQNEQQTPEDKCQGITQSPPHMIDKNCLSVDVDDDIDELECLDEDLEVSGDCCNLVDSELDSLGSPVVDRESTQHAGVSPTVHQQQVVMRVLIVGVLFHVLQSRY